MPVEQTWTVEQAQKLCPPNSRIWRDTFNARWRVFYGDIWSKSKSWGLAGQGNYMYFSILCDSFMLTNVLEGTWIEKSGLFRIWWESCKRMPQRSLDPTYCCDWPKVLCQRPVRHMKGSHVCLAAAKKWFSDVRWRGWIDASNTWLWDFVFDDVDQCFSLQVLPRNGSDLAQKICGMTNRSVVCVCACLYVTWCVCVCAFLVLLLFF